MTLATDLIDAAHVRDIVRREISMAEHGKWSVGVIVVCLPDVQALIQHAGQLVAQQASQIVAGAMKRVFRETDVLCRKGEFELLAVLPGNDHNGNCIAKDRLSAELVFLPHYKLLERETISIELFTFDAPSDTEQSFFAKVFASKRVSNTTKS